MDYCQYKFWSNHCYQWIQLIFLLDQHTRYIRDFLFSFANFACVVVLTDDSFSIHYLFPNTKRQVVDLKGVVDVTFQLSYFFIPSDDVQLRMSFLLHPYDTIVFHYKDETIIPVNVNMCYPGTWKIRRLLKNKI